MTVQTSLNLVFRPSMDSEDFFVSSCNVEIVEYLKLWQQWQNKIFIICGPEHSGKTHLLSIWKNMAQAHIIDFKATSEYEVIKSLDEYRAFGIDNIDCKPQEKLLFHVVNHCMLEGKPLCMTAQRSPASWPFVLPDLLSRLRIAVIKYLELPDDETLKILLIKQLADCNLPIPENAVQFILKRIERSYGAVRGLVQDLNQYSLQEKSKINYTMLNNILHKY